MSNKVVHTIRPNNIHNYWRELWGNRELCALLAWRNVVVRYKQTTIGLLWCVIRPSVMLGIFYVIFGIVARMPTDSTAPYAVVAFAGLAPWLFFANAVSDASASLIDEGSLISKVYFPRIVIPLASAAAALVDFLIVLVLLVPVILVTGYTPSSKIIFLPLLALLAIVPAVGIGVFFAALNAAYRDFRYVIPFILQLGIYVSPVVYTSAAVPEKFKLLYFLNPMAGVIDGFRWAIINQPLYWPGITLSSFVAVIALIGGFRFFSSVERTLADKV